MYITFHSNMSLTQETVSETVADSVDTPNVNDETKIVKEVKRHEKLLSNCDYCASLGRHRQHLPVIKCRCGKEFCLKHREADIHKCTFDYRNPKHKEEMFSRWMGIQTVNAKKVADF